jgi:hypothetical protein
MNLVRIRRLNDAGLARMQEFIDSFAETPAQSVSFQHDLWPILSDPYSTSHAPNVVQADADRVFPRRYDMAEYLHGLIAGLGLSDPTRDKGVWAWLALLWFDQLAPAVRGSRKVGEQAKWLPESGWKYYRHLVLGAYLIYATNHDRPQRALALLHNPPHTPGELVGQLAATQDVAQSKAAIGAATTLYYDTDRGTMKRGAGGSGAGSPRRLRTVLDQLDRTFDLQSLNEDRLLALLPAEFDRYKRDA